MINKWKTKIAAADKLYKDWSGTFWPDKLRQYYEGKQWVGASSQPSRTNPYVVNLVASTIETKKAALLFTEPKFKVSPRPGQSNWNLEAAILGAQLKEDFLNTVTSDPAMNFVCELELAALDSFTHFAVLEVGVSTSFLNPLYDAPVVNEETEKVEQEYEVVAQQSPYVRRIMPWRFRVSADDQTSLERSQFYGYYDFIALSLLKTVKEIAKNIPAGYSSGKYERGFGDVDNDYERRDAELVKVWHIWCNQTRKRYLLLDGDFTELWSEPFESREVWDYRWKVRQRGWYPIPPVYDWVSPQDEINESREQMRNYRRRFTRKFAVSDQVSQDELEKFTTGGDGTVISVPGNVTDKFAPIPNPDIGGTVKDTLIASKDDFNIVSATSSDVRGQGDRTTATAAKITAQRSEIRDSYAQRKWANYVGSIGRGLLATCKNKLSGAVWIAVTKDPGDEMFAEAQENIAYAQISSQDLNDGFDAAVSIDVVNNTPAAQEEQKIAFIEFLTLTAQYPQLSLKPDLIREAAFRVGYRNEKVIREMQQAILLQQTIEALSGAGGVEGGDATNSSRGVAEQNEANTSAEVESQLNSQVEV